MAQEERLMILQMVADKKITASEAAELLKALDTAREAAPTVPPAPAAPLAPKALPSPGPVNGPGRTANLGSGLGSFIENIVDRITTAVADAVEPRYEFPATFTGQFADEEIPLRIATGNGKMDIRTWDEPGYKAEVVVKARGASEEEARVRARDAYTVKADEHGFDLEARRYDIENTAVHVTLTVPRNRRYRLEGRTGNGHVELLDLPLADAKVTTGNGRITCRGGRAEKLAIRSGNGSVEVETDAADLEAGTGNGSLLVHPAGSRSQSMRLSTGNGSVRILAHDLSAGAGLRVEAHTGMGSVGLNIPNLSYEKDERTIANKHVVASTANFEQAAVRVNITARTGMGSIIVE